MPVQIQCTSVVIRNDALDRVLDGGSEDFASIAPNAMSYSDERLSQASFMSPVDAEEFAKRLELRGLQRDVDSPDFVIVQTHNQSIEPPCDWLLLFEYERRLIATIRGSSTRKVVVAATNKAYDPDAIKHYSADEIAENFEFVERKGNIDTYREKKTGTLVYHARKTESGEEIFSRAFEVVWQLRREPGQPPKQDDQALTIRNTIESLQQLQAKNPTKANIALALGMAWFAIGLDEKSHRQFNKAHSLEPENTIVLKEMAGLCLAKRDFPSALVAAQKALAVKPDDSELLGNLAAIQLIMGDVFKAQSTVQYAIQVNPDDKVNQNIHAKISSVASGKCVCPGTLEEMMRPLKPTSWFARLFRRQSLRAK